MPTKFEEKVYSLMRKTPRGRVTTYGLIAKALRKPNAARAVGNACNRNPYAPKVPCHRVVRADGSLGGFAGGPRKKAKLLAKEGVRVENGRIVGFEKRHYKF